MHGEADCHLQILYLCSLIGQKRNNTIEKENLIVFVAGVVLCCTALAVQWHTRFGVVGWIYWERGQVVLPILYSPHKPGYFSGSLYLVSYEHIWTPLDRDVRTSDERDQWDYSFIFSA